MVAAACACAEQAERNRGATTRVTPFFSPALSRALAPFASAALVASGVADPTARGSTAPSGLSRLAVSPSSAARARGASLSERRERERERLAREPGEPAVRTAVRTRRFTFFARRERRGASRRAVFRYRDGGVRPAVRLDGPAETRLRGPPARRARGPGLTGVSSASTRRRASRRTSRCRTSRRWRPV